MSNQTSFSIFSRAGGQSSASLPANDQIEIDVGDVPLQDIPRPSTETVRRNGFRQSQAEEHSTRIIEDIRNRVATCCICTEAFSTVSDREYTIWSCHDCYNIFHFRCIETWAKRRVAAATQARIGLLNWRCPTCIADKSGLPTAQCWCGKDSTNFNHNHNEPNACRENCGRVNKCKHHQETNPCDKPCHPGRCKTSCSETCNGQMPVPPREPTSWDKFKARWRRRRRGPLRWFGFTVLGVITFYILFLLFMSFHIRWITQPYRYRWTYISLAGYQRCSVVIGRLLLLCVAGFIYVSMLGTWGVLKDLLNLQDKSTRARSKSFALRIAPFVVILAAFSFAVPIYVGIEAVPDIAWYNQMKDSCEGFDTRLDMKLYNGQKLNRVFTLHSLSSPTTDGLYHLGTHFSPQITSKDPWQLYHTFSGGNTVDGYVNINIDMMNHLWRIERINGTNDANKWQAEGNAKADGKSFPQLPEFQPIQKEMVNNGSFSWVSAQDMHMRIPELNLSIANMHSFIDDCQQEPFLRVFHTHGKSEQEAESSLNKGWSQKDDSVVMRTASFGHGRQRLTMCMKEGPMPGSDGKITSRVSEDLMVPFAIISAYRVRIWETKMRGFCT